MEKYKRHCLFMSLVKKNGKNTGWINTTNRPSKSGGR